MAEHLRLANSQLMAWPARCAKCLTKTDLTMCNATSGRIESVRPTLGGSILVKSDLLSLSYPVCVQHVRGLSLANLLTRNTLGARSLRAMLYFLGPLSIVTLAGPLLIYAVSIAKPAAYRASDLSAGMFLLFMVFAVAFALVIWSFKRLPVRISKHSTELISLAFGNSLYAKEFARLNESLIR